MKEIKEVLTIILKPESTFFLSSIILQVLTTYSKTKVSVSRVWTMSCSVTMLLCFSSFSSEASRMAVRSALLLLQPDLLQRHPLVG